MNLPRSIWLLLLLLLTGASAQAADWHEFPGGRWQALPVPASGKTGFQLLSPADTGLSFTNTLREADGAQNRTLFNGSGVATGDFDGDGRPDIALAGLEGKLSLFRNLGGWRFTNVTAESGVVATNFMARGVVLADLNGDGSLDLLLSANGAGVRCWTNDGHGHFTDVTTNAGTASRLGSMTLALADVDGNGTPDLYIANNRTDDIRDRGQVKLISVKGQVTVPNQLTNRLLLREGHLLEYGEPDRLLLNDGHGQFHAASWTNGTFLDEAGNPLLGAPLDWGLTATFRDLNGDGAPDIYVCNDFWTPDRLWLNDGHGHFRAAPALALRQTSGSSMGVDIADVDLDGHPDLFTVDMLSRSPAWRKRQAAAQAEGASLPGVIADRPQSLRNTLQLGRGDGTFAEIAEIAGLAAAEWAWQPLFLDVDLDGWPDLLITTGHAHDSQDLDAQTQVDARQPNLDGIASAADRRLAFTRSLLANLHLYPPLATPLVAFRNRGDLHFDDVTGDWGTGQLGIHHGIALADFDGDGDLDLVINNLNAPAALYRNDTVAPRVAVRLTGRAPNTQAVGAVVTLHGGAVPTQRQEVVLGGRYLSGSDPQLMFAAGKGNTPMTLEVRWRNGTRREIKEVQADRLSVLTEEAALDQPIATAPAALPPPLFTDTTGRLGHSHQEILYDDFARQPLLPRRLSQAGPGLAWLDWDGDGWEDLAIGGGAGGQLAIYRNDQHGGFVLATNLPAGRDQVALAATGQRLLIAESNYEDGQTNGAAISVVEPGKPPAMVLPAATNAFGALALADYDGDGNLDLFVGGRVVPGRWPEAASSVLLRNDGAKYIPAQTFDHLGLVTSAVWSDLNGDGFPELILACEWGPLKVFRNDHGKLTPWDPSVTLSGNAPGAKSMPLSALSGWWTGLAAGDFDGDGRLDLIAANWGLNSTY
ncbi:MAG TPA: VCBS repeat-containing protein, partial [Candidatus Limnocylindria bacterium]|nr:VCBS repeat-containing protein [Candidatus Limnocylindria bacterium]